MLRTFSADPNYGYDRYEVGLKNRTDQNMAFLFQYLYSLIPEIRFHSGEIESFTNIKCTDLKNYKYAALYFVGFIIDTKSSHSTSVEMIKLHYLLRKCANPDKIGKNYIINNDSSLQTLSTIGIPEMQQLVAFVTKLLKTEHAELWMSAVDYHKNGDSKYKIYFKNIQMHFYKKLSNEFYRIGHGNLSKKIDTYMQWINIHPELEKYGMAICFDNHKHWSINFYH